MRPPRIGAGKVIPESPKHRSAREGRMLMLQGHEAYTAWHVNSINARRLGYSCSVGT